MTVTEYNNCVDNYSDGIYRFLLKQTNNNEIAKDLVQDTFEKLWIHVKNVDYRKAKSYLFTTAYHKMIDHYRKEKPIHDLQEFHLNQHYTSQHNHDVNEILHKTIQNLPEVQRAVILLRDYEGYSYDEIAKITELSASQVKVYIYRARTYLKNVIGKVEVLI